MTTTASTPLSDEEAEAEDLKTRLEFSATFSRELAARMGRLDGIIGDRHWLSVGTYKELLLADVLRNHLPRRYEIGNGFVMAVLAGKRVLSKQIDLLIWDSQEHAPVFRDGTFVIVPPEACVAAIEVKSTLSGKSLKEAMENLKSLNVFLELARPGASLHKAIFAYQLDGKFAFPKGILRDIHRNFLADLANNLTWSQRFDQMWSLPWIDNIGILGKGTCSLRHWSLDEQSVPTYVAIDTQNSGLDDTFGQFAWTLHADLITKSRRGLMRMTHPGKASMAIPIDSKMVGFVAMKSRPSKTSTIGSLSGATLKRLLAGEVVPKI